MKHLSACEVLGAKWQTASHPITDQWPPRRLSRWDATTLSLHGHADTDESSMQCLPPVRPFRQKAGHRHSEPLIGSQTGSLFFRAQMAAAPWRTVFREWIGRLLPATPSAGGHGLIRTAHALR